MNARRLFAAAAALAAMVAGWSATVSAAEIESTIARGGRLYDTWYKEIKANRPDNPHPSYPAAGKKAKQSWRCVTCHGWDYKGDKELGIKGIAGAAGKDPAAITAILRDKTHAYPTDMLNDKDAADLALFVSKGQIDLAKYVDPASGKPKGSTAKGEIYYNTLCGVCHGPDGKKVSTGMPLGQAAEFPTAVLHKAYNGQPAEAMPMLRAFDNTIASDIVAYIQQLPK
ncbi:MAG: cytochrome c [Solirubrobacterales bacterium]